MLRTRLEAAHWTKSISRGGDLVEQVDSDVDVDHTVGDLVDGDLVKMILLKVHHVEGVRVTGARLHGVQGHGGGGG